MAEIEEPSTNGTNGTNDTSFPGSDGCSDSAYENPIVKIVRGIQNVSDETVRKIRDSDVLQRDLSALTEDDLKLFGIEDATVQRNMIAKFTNSPNQLLHYDKYIENMDVDKYREVTYKNVQDQLRVMNKVLEASQIILQSNPINDRLIDDNVYVSSLNTKAIKEILKTVSRITKTTETNRWTIWLYSIAGLTLLGTLLTLPKVIKF